MLYNAQGGNMSIEVELPNIYKSILVVNVPGERASDQNFRRFQQRGALFVPAGKIRFSRDIPPETEVIAIYSPHEVSPDATKLPEYQQPNDQNRLVMELAAARFIPRRIPCFVTHTLESLENFLDSRLLGSKRLSSLNKSKDVPHREYVEVRAPKGHDFNVKSLASTISKEATKDGVQGLSPVVVRKYLSRLRDARKRHEHEVVKKVQEPKEIQNAPRLNQRDYTEAPVAELPEDLVREARRLGAAVRIEAYVSRLTRKLPISDASYVNAIYKLAVDNGFPLVKKSSIYTIMLEARRKGGDKCGFRVRLRKSKKLLRVPPAMALQVSA
jgi:hypothetical protein